MSRRIQVGDERLALRDGPVKDWFTSTFPGGPTPAQADAWPAIAAREHLLLVSPTGTGKTLAAFLAILDGFYHEFAAGTIRPGLRSVYISPLRSLGYDVERNLGLPIEAIRVALGLDESPVTIGIRTGDTSSHARGKMREKPPHILITTPESLSLLLSQSAWDGHWKSVDQIIIDEVHALAATKRGADLLASVERLSARSDRDPIRVGLSATCRPTDRVARFLVGPGRTCRVIEAEAPAYRAGLTIEVESLLKADESSLRALTYRRLLRRLGALIRANRTTVIFANTRAFAEKITHDLRGSVDDGDTSIAAHHSALDAGRRRQVEAALKEGSLKAVVTSTSLELGVDIGSADLSVLVGLPGGTSRCLQRIGRSGHRPGSSSRGILFASTAAELAGAVVTAQAARLGQVEPLRPIRAPLDVLCQQLIGMACSDEWSSDEAFVLLKKSAPFEDLSRADFDACLSSLAGDLAAPAGAFEPEDATGPRWTSPRIWSHRGRFGLQTRRVARWFRGNVGTITSEESVRVVADGAEIGSLEGAYAERLQAGDRFVLDGRSFEFRRLDGLIVHARRSAGEPDLPRWTSDRQSLSAELARDLACFRQEAARWHGESPEALRAWLCETHGLEPEASELLENLFASQAILSEVPLPGCLLVEESPHVEGFAYSFHAPLARSACEALGRAVAARLGRRFGRNLGLVVADLGWSIRLPAPSRLDPSEISGLLDPNGFEDDVLDGLDRGDLPARRFRHIAGTALMVLRRPEGKRTRVGGLLWVSQRLYPLVKAACPDHPLLRETRREVLEDLLDAPGALDWLRSAPIVRFRSLDAPSPFTAAWIDSGGSEPMQFESPAEALKRLHARLVGP